MSLIMNNVVIIIIPGINGYSFITFIFNKIKINDIIKLHLHKSNIIRCDIINFPNFERNL